MSKEIHYYKNVHPETAYIAGIAEAMVSSLDVELSVEHYSIDTDVFWIGKNRIDVLYDVILKRLRKYNSIDLYDLCLERDCFMPNLPIKKLDGNMTVNSVTEIIENYVKRDKIAPAVKDFILSVNWYLKLPCAVYKTDMQTLYEYMPELEKALRAFYLFVISELIFVEYDGYVLMLVIGASE